MSKGDKRYAIAVCVFVFLAMGFCGWYENHVPAPQPSIEQMVRACDREVARNMSQQGERR
jgi:hypothetical protein